MTNTDDNKDTKIKEEGTDMTNKDNNKDTKKDFKKESTVVNEFLDNVEKNKIVHDKIQEALNTSKALKDLAKTVVSETVDKILEKNPELATDRFSKSSGDIKIEATVEAKEIKEESKEGAKEEETKEESKEEAANCEESEEFVNTFSTWIDKIIEVMCASDKLMKSLTSIDSCETATALKRKIFIEVSQSAAEKVFDLIQEGKKQCQKEGAKNDK